MENPLVSIIIPVYNVELYIEDCLNSIISQTYREIEVIIVDDGSTDSSITIIDKFMQTDSRLKIYQNIHGGQSVARNIGIQYATGYYLYFVDSDDILISTAIETLVYIAVNESVDIVRTTAQDFVDKTEIKGMLYAIPSGRRNTSSMSIDAFLEDSNYYAFPILWLYFLKASLIKSNPLLFFKEGIMSEDTLFIPQLLSKAHKISYCNKFTYLRRVRPNSLMTTENNNEWHFKSIVIVNEELTRMLNSESMSRAFRKYLRKYQERQFFIMSTCETENLKANFALGKKLRIPFLLKNLVKVNVGKIIRKIRTK